MAVSKTEINADCTKKSSTGMDAKVAVLLAYLFSWLGGLIIWLIEKVCKMERSSGLNFGYMSVYNHNIIFLDFNSDFCMGFLASIYGVHCNRMDLLSGLICGRNNLYRSGISVQDF
jgi:hypothetical protein